MSEMSEVTRRGFLGLLAAMVPAAFVKAHGSPLWMPTQSIVPVQQDAILSLNQLTQAFADALGKRLDPMLIKRGATKIGAVAGGIGFARQVGIEFEAPAQVGPAGVERVQVAKLADTFAEFINRNGKPVAVAELPIDLAGAQVCRVTDTHTHGLSVRGAKIWDLREDQYRIRFDVLVAR